MKKIDKKNYRNFFLMIMSVIFFCTCPLLTSYFDGVFAVLIVLKLSWGPYRPQQRKS